MTNEIKLVTKQLNSTVVNMKGLLISSNYSWDPPLFVVLTFVILRISDYTAPADLFTHTVEHTHLLQVSGTSSRWLHKAKKGKDLAQKRQTQVQ